MSDGVSPPFYQITDTDKGGIMVVITTFFLVSIWVCLGVRAYVRIRINGPMKWDDFCVAGATILSSVRSGIVYHEARLGFGKTSELLSENAIAHIGKALYADNIFYFLALYVSKCAVVLLFQRLTPKTSHNKMLMGVLAFSTLWLIASILLLSINCSPGHPWEDLNAQCSFLDVRWKVIFAFDTVTEVALVGSAFYLVMDLQMSAHFKLLVMFAFGIRIGTVLFASLRLNAILTEVSSLDPTLFGAYTSAFTQIELDYSILACTLTTVGALLKPFNQELGPSRSGSKPGRYAMNSLPSNTQSIRREATRLGSTEDLPTRPDKQYNTATVTTRNSMSLHSEDSARGIIRKEVAWTVDRDRH